MIILNEPEKATLERRHRTERDRRIADRIKAVLLSSEGWSAGEIAQALRLSKATILDHLTDYETKQKLKPENGGSSSKLTLSQAEELISHLESVGYETAESICDYVKRRYGVFYSRQGMTDWLHAHKFSYKFPKGTPAKANAEKQEEFIKQYEELKNKTPEDEPIEFLDAVHPTMATKISRGWIRTGKDKTISTTASRTRLNILGSINLETMNVTYNGYQTINGTAIIEHFDLLRQKYPNAPRIHVILDNGPYNKSKETQKAATERGIILHFLPPYSPNLNPIERLWKVMNEYARNNVFFTTAEHFRREIHYFFDVTWPSIAKSMVDRINDIFHVLGKGTSF